jgi:hypothetical protein
MKGPEQREWGAGRGQRASSQQKTPSKAQAGLVARQ